MSTLTNIFDVLLGLLFLFLASILLLHRALWPLLTRTLFRMTDIELLVQSQYRHRPPPLGILPIEHFESFGLSWGRAGSF
jgi:hypothetical protein